MTAYPCDISTAIVTETPHSAEITVSHGEDWYEAVPQLVDPVTCDPFDVTGKVMHLYVRPTFGSDPLILHLGTVVSGDGIRIEDGPEGLIGIFVAQAVMDTLPVGTWEQFFTIDLVDATYGTVTKILWRGPFFVKSADDSLT
jgi:hypothetical protein